MKANDILRKIVFVGLFVVPFLPLAVSGGLLFPFIAGKNFVFRVIVEIILAAWAVLAVSDSAYRPKKSLVLVAFSVFVAVVALADFFGENPYRSFWSNYERMEGLIGHLHLFAYFLVATSMLHAEKLWHRFFSVSFGVNAAIVVYSFFQLAGKLIINQGGVRVDSTFGNATYLAVYLLFQIFLLAFWLVRGASRNEDGENNLKFLLGGFAASSLFVAYSLSVPLYAYFLSAAGAAVGAVVLFFTLRGENGLKLFMWLLLLSDLFVLYRTETRGAILGLIGGVAISVVLIAIGNRGNKKIRNVSAGVLIGLLVMAGLFFVFKDSSFVRSNSTLARFSSISVNEATTKSRLMIWDMSFKAFKERPILGWGQENFIVVFSEYYNPKMWSQEPWFDRSHNVFFDWVVAGGALGVLSYLALFGAGLYMAWKSRKFSFTEKSILTGLLAGYFFQNLFVFDNLVSYVMFFSVLGFVSVIGRGGEEVIDGSKSRRNDGPSDIPYAIVPMTLIVLIGVMYYANVKPVLASYYMVNGLTPNEKGLPANVEYFKDVFALNTFGSGEAREQLIQLANRLKDLNAPAEDKQSLFSLASEQMALQVKEAPTDVRYSLYLGSFLSNIGNYDEAIKYLKDAAEKSPQKQLVLFELAGAYVNKMEMDTGLKYFKAAYDAAPDYPEAVLSYAAGLIYAGRDKEADVLLTSMYKTVLVPDARLMSAYEYRHMYDRIIDTRKKQLEDNPADQQVEILLASTYLKTGMRDSAIGVLRDIIKQYPEFKDRGEYFIKEIQAGRNP